MTRREDLPDFHSRINEIVQHERNLEARLDYLAEKQEEVTNRYVLNDIIQEKKKINAMLESLDCTKKLNMALLQETSHKQ